MISKSEGLNNLLLSCLCSPETIVNLTMPEWELLVHCARQCKLLTHLSNKIDSVGLSSDVPAQVKLHFIAAQRLADHRNRLALWELNRIRRALFGEEIDVIVLKGGAYQLLKLPFSYGRLLSDIDILVHKSNLQVVEMRLKEQGWVSAELDEYDQYYYRTWMHEVPPLRHQERYIEVDLHHTILPLTSRLKPSPALLFEDSDDVDGTGYKVLSAIDMILHSSAHLFYDGELNGSDFRDLVDLSELITYFEKQYEGFFDLLLERANQLTLQRPLFYTLLFTNQLLQIAIPEKIIQDNRGRPGWMARTLMLQLVPLALLPGHPDFQRKRVVVARWLLYVRSHFLRMPLHLLIPHLLKKSRKRLDENIL